MEDHADQGKVYHDMRDLNLGPDTKRLVQNFNHIVKHTPHDGTVISACAVAMAAMLERWLNVGWCWPDACPATVCGGPHVKVRYDFDKTVDVIEPIHKVGTTFAEAPYHVITD